MKRYNDFFGSYGGRFVAEMLRAPLDDLQEAFLEAAADPAFTRELEQTIRDFAGRPTPLLKAENAARELGGAAIYIKCEGLAHTGAHKINNAVGQALLARRMGKKRIIAETGAGQHGVATAAVAARFGLECEVHMGEEDIRRQKLNVRRMELMGAKVRPALSGSRTLKDATNEAIRDWVANVENTFYLIGSVVGPHPYPAMVRDFQSCIGREAKAQMLARAGCLPTYAVACVGGGSNAMGLFHPLSVHPEIQLIGIEAAGEGVDTERHAATLTKGRPGVLHGAMSFLLQDAQGQVQEAHSISAGLDYPGIGPEHAHFHTSERARYESATDAEAIHAFETLSRLEGIIPAFESSHALAWVLRNAGKLTGPVLLCLSGRGDKDMEEYLLHKEGK